MVLKDHIRMVEMKCGIENKYCCKVSRSHVDCVDHSEFILTLTVSYEGPAFVKWFCLDESMDEEKIQDHCDRWMELDMRLRN